MSEQRQTTTRDILTLLSASDQQAVASMQLQSSFGPDQLQTTAAVPVLRRVLELFGQQRLQEVLAACCPDVAGSWSTTEAVVDGKVYIFGGRGSDNRTRGSMHVLDCAKVSVSQLKTLNAPDARDGHSCLYYDGKLILFGGCEGAEDEVTLFNQVHTLDLTTREWHDFPTTGEVPSGRDGHAAAIIGDVMLIYGGGTARGVTGEMLGLNLVKGLWQRYQIEGDDPGPRESTSCTTLGTSLYVFGGNVNPNANACDIYSNDLYRLDLKPRAVSCVLIRPFTDSPPPRLSCSMCAVTPAMLVIFGGECEQGMLSDIWVHHLNLNLWRELRPRTHIEGRIAHIGTSHNGKLLIFGGLDKDSNARNEISTLTLLITPCSYREILARPIPVQPRPQVKSVCKMCLHGPKICETGKFPGLIFPSLHYMSRILPTVDTITEVIETESDWSTNFIHFLERVISAGISHVQVKAAPLDEANGRGKGKEHVGEMIVVGNKGLGPKEIAELTAGTRGSVEKQVRCIADQSIFLSRTDEFITCCVLSEEAGRLSHVLVVFDRQGTLLSPATDSSAATRVYKEINYADIVAAKPGLTVIFKLRKMVIVRGSDIFVPSSMGSISLSEILKNLYFNPIESPPEIFLNETKICHEFAMRTTCQREERHSKFIVRTLDVAESWPFEVRLYYRNFLMRFKLVEVEKVGKKRRAVVGKPCDIIVTHDSLINLQTRVIPTQSLIRSSEILDLFDFTADSEDNPRRVRRPSAAVLPRD